MFQRRPPRAVYENLVAGPPTLVDAKFPQSVHIENCHRGVFTIEQKITSLTILKCSELTINFSSIISNVEIIRSPSILLATSGRVGTFNVDHSNDCEIQFLSTENSDVQIITTNCTGCEVIVKKNSLDASEEEEKRFLVEDAGVQRPPESEEAEIPVPDSVVQYRTAFKDGEFLTSRLEREGPLGYFKNQN